METKLKKVEKTELEKAQELINKIETEKQHLFKSEYEALCKKHGYSIDAVTQLVIKKTQ